MNRYLNERFIEAIKNKYSEKYQDETELDFDIPLNWMEEDLQKFLLYCVKLKVSDIVFKTNEYIYIRLDGRWLPVTKNKISQSDMEILIEVSSKSNSTYSSVISGQPLDYSYSIRAGRGLNVRFRSNATAVSSGGSNTGVSITFRVIAGVPPSLSDFEIEQDLIDNIFIDKGLVLVTGVMGSGKSTLVASVLHDRIKNEEVNVLTYEDPIEFDYGEITEHKAIVQQTEVPTQLREGFDGAVTNSTRRAADIILMGESRNRETFIKMLEQSQIGSAVYSTVHTNTVASTITRIINTYPSEEQNQVASMLISTIRLIVQQRLLPTKDGKGRIPIREYLNFTQKIKKHLLETPLKNIEEVIQSYVETQGQSLFKNVTEKYKKGLIREQDYLKIQKELN